MKFLTAFQVALYGVAAMLAALALSGCESDYPIALECADYTPAPGTGCTTAVWQYRRFGFGHTMVAENGAIVCRCPTKK